MKIKTISVDSSYRGEYEATLEFTANNQMLVNYILANRDKEFNITPRERMDGLSAMIYAIDEMHAVRNHETKVIFNPPATILIKNGKKYVSKAHEEKFDEEKGLLMCLAKANGITHLELKRMIKNAKRPKKKDEAIVLASNPVQAAYDILTLAFNKKKVIKNELLVALEEAIGYLGEALDD